MGGGVFVCADVKERVWGGQRVRWTEAHRAGRARRRVGGAELDFNGAAQQGWWSTGLEGWRRTRSTRLVCASTVPAAERHVTT